MPKTADLVHLVRILADASLFISPESHLGRSLPLTSNLSTFLLKICTSAKF